MATVNLNSKLIPPGEASAIVTLAARTDLEPDVMDSQNSWKLMRCIHIFLLRAIVLYDFLAK